LLWMLLIEAATIQVLLQGAWTPPRRTGRHEMEARVIPNYGLIITLWRDDEPVEQVT
jgi:hypothetical protein